MQKGKFDDDGEADVYTLTDEDGNESDFELLGCLDEDGQTYVALAPMDEDGDEEENFIVMKVIEENGEEIFKAIEADDEFDRIAGIFEDKLMRDLDYVTERDICKKCGAILRQESVFCTKCGTKR